MPGGDVIWEGSSLSSFYTALFSSVGAHPGGAGGGGSGSGSGVNTATFHSDGTNEFDVNEATAAAYASAFSLSQVQAGTSSTDSGSTPYDPGLSEGQSVASDGSGDSIEEVPEEMSDLANIFGELFANPILDNGLPMYPMISVTSYAGETPFDLGLFAQANWNALESGHYWNPGDQALDPFHPGEWTFRGIFSTVCSDHMTVNSTTGEESHHTDTINPLPGWAVVFGPLTPFVWETTFAAHALADMAGFYPASAACQ